MESKRLKAQYRPYERVEGNHSRTIVVGDIHGCWDEFQQLLEMTQFGPEDLLVSVGDFMDRGPGSWELAGFFRDTPNAYSVLGNHERRIVGTVRGTSQPAWSQKQTLSLISEDDQEEWGSFLEALPAVVETDHAIVTHARLDPSIPLSEQEVYFTAAVGGSTVRIEMDEDEIPLWFKSMRFDKPVCMGHLGYDRVELVPNGLYALDTKACRGGLVTAVILPAGQIVQIRANRDYLTEARTQWRQTRDRLGQSPLTWPLSYVLHIMNNGEKKGSDLQNALVVIVSHILDLDIEKMERRISDNLDSLFGQIPPPGPGRGDYYKGIKSVFSSRSHGALVGRILSGKPLELKTLAHVFPGIRVEELGEELRSFSTILEEKLQNAGA